MPSFDKAAAFTGALDLDDARAGDDLWGAAAPASAIAAAPVDPIALTASGTNAGETLMGTAGADQLHGLGGRDSLYGLGGDDQLWGDADNDTLFGGDGSDTLRGGAGLDLLEGGAGNDTLVGSDLSTDTQVDRLYGGAGDDGISSAIGDIADGGAGQDYIDLRLTGQAIAVNIDILASSRGIVQSTGAGSLVGFERIYFSGGALDDTVIGGNGANSLHGGGGADYLQGGLAGDTLRGGDGADIMYGGAGADSYYIDDNLDEILYNVEDGSDSVDSAELYEHTQILVTGYRDYVFGSRVDDLHEIIWYVFENGHQIILYDCDAYVVIAPAVIQTGTVATDYLRGSDVVDEIDGGAGADVLRGMRGEDTLAGGDGDDILLGGRQDDILRGGAGQDRFLFSAGEGGDVIEDFDTGAGGDVVQLNGSMNYTLEQVGEDLRIRFNTYNFILLKNVLASDLTSDNIAVVDTTLTGAPDSDALQGSAFDDILLGLGGTDSLSGLEGDDRLEGGAGADILDGGEGRDTASYVDAADAVTIDRQQGLATGEASGDTFVSIEAWVLSAWNDRFVAGPGSNEVDGGAGDDTLIGHNGADVLRGGEGDDLLTGGLGSDVLDGGAGIDRVSFLNSTSVVRIDLTTGIHAGADVAGDTFTSIEVFGLSQNNDNFTGLDADERVSGFGGNDVLNGGRGNDVLNGGAGIDTLNGGDGDDRLDGGDGDDKLDGGSGDDRMSGGDDRDTLSGREGDDRLDGGAGDDILWGDAGTDVLTGGAGADQFWVARVGSGQDRVTDFVNGEDRIRITGVAGVDDFSDLVVTSNGSGWAVITFPDGASLTLEGVAQGDVDASDFVWI